MKNDYEIQEKAWVVSEIKASMVEVFNNFVVKRDQYVKSLQGVVDPQVARAEFVAALYEFYNMMLNGYVQDLSRVKTESVPANPHTEIEYQQLAYKDTNFDEKKLLSMSYELTKWAFTKGYFRITHQEIKFGDVVDQMEYENTMT